MDMDVVRHHFKNAKYAKCAEFCLKIIKNNIENIEAWSLCALSYEKLGRRDEAIECLQEALKIDKISGGDNAFSLSVNLAEFYRRNNMTLQAIALLNGFLPREDGNLHFNLAKCYADLHDYEQSIKHYAIAIQINPSDMHAVFNLANQQAAIGSIKTALKYYLLAYEGGVDDAGINLAQIYSELGKMDFALEIYKKLEPIYNKDSNFYFNYANTLWVSGNIEQARQKYINAISIHADVRYIINLAYLLLSIEDFNSGFPLYEYRRNLLAQIRANSFPRHFLDFGLDNRDSLLTFIRDKKIAIYHEQGFGDSIMFARFIPRLVCRAKTIFVSKELELLFSCFGLDVKTSISQDYDISIPMPSLAFLLADSASIRESLSEFSDLLKKYLNSSDNKQIESNIKHHLGILNDTEAKPSLIDDSNNQDANLLIKNDNTNSISMNTILQSYNLPKQDNLSLKHAKTYTSYKININKKTRLKHNKLDSINKNPNKILRVGLNFSSNPNFQDARKKSIYPKKLLEALPRNGMKYISLQYEGFDLDLADEYGVIDMSKYIRNFLDSALIIKNLDIVISIDSAIAHLSATLGVETLVLLHKKHDWRWGRIGANNGTIWYDKVKLFIQESPNRWDKPLKGLRKYLVKRYQSF
ncbi:tetratricopeptide repeat protein [Helicobacter muridarum]|uniref:TPR repeat-containing protein n=1 Tax=Helicobacter muridarum TaxID=216 RepID=A0A099TZ24_9HELI|nr:tetratricopeptide repeat protein [Helicobacter muridarum]TLE00051.1 tetratricopeptide repeat protein [Helicobacter muridarum]STQ86102.1 TPR repeat-containing protein [Helicobacter muridarum]